jgi:Leucine-rich repeat (LRR) protein
LKELKHLNLGMNRLSRLPKNFPDIPQLQMLDLTYNNFTEESVGTQFWDPETPLSKEIALI